MALIIDVETTGLPDCSGLGFGKYPPIENLDKYDSSRIVQISIMICNERFEELELKDFIIKADGFSIDNSGFHGITNEISEKEGKHFKEIAEILLECLSKGSYVIAHNAKFDVNVIKSELFRLGLNSIIEEMIYVYLYIFNIRIRIYVLHIFIVYICNKHTEFEKNMKYAKNL